MHKKNLFSTVRSMILSLVLFWALWNGDCVSLAATGEGIEIRQVEKPFVILTRHVADSGAGERQDFAWIALSELIAIYEKVIAESRFETPERSSDQNRLRGWRSGAAAFIGELYVLLERLNRGAEVEIQAGGAGAAVLFIDEAPLVISGPEIDAASRMERRIIDSFCSLYTCPDLFPRPEQAIADLNYVGRGSWLLDNQRPARYLTPDGLVFVFSSLASRREKQEACEAIAGELRTLLEGMMATRRAALPIEWGQLAVRPLKGAPGSHVRVNKDGDYLRLNLPYLERTDLLENGGLEWLMQRLDGKSAGATFYQAERFMGDRSSVDR